MRKHLKLMRNSWCCYSGNGPWGTEVILGSVNDPTFGPTVMFGLGGIFVEVLKDVTFRVAPFSKNQAMEMMDEIKAAPILSGIRGEKPKDKKSLQRQFADTRI